MKEKKAARGGAFLRRALAAGASGLALVFTLAINEHLRAGVMLFPAHARWWALAMVLLPAAAAWVAFNRMGGLPRLSRRRWKAEFPYGVLVACTALALVSGAVLHPWTYFSGWLPVPDRGLGNWTAGLPRFVLLTAALTPLLIRPRRRLDRGLWVLLAAAQLACLIAFYRTTGGAALYKDDHPSFLFRLWEFSRTFPQYLNYNPWWNGGAVNAYCTSSGTGALGLPLLPLWRFFAIHKVYTTGLALVYILAMPWLAAASLRIMGANRSAAACAGLLTLGVSRHFFLWLLHYGTVCAPLVAFFTLPVAACLYRVIWLDRREKWLAAALVVSAGMLLQWPPGGLMAFPIVAGFLLSWRQWSWKKIRFLLVCGGLVLVLCSRLLLVILLKGGTVVSHVLEPGSASSSLEPMVALTQGFDFLVAHLQEGHPLILFLGFAGLVSLSARSMRRWFWPMLLGFALLTGWGPQLKPKLELGRMAIPMMFLAVGPAAAACSRLLRGTDWRLAPARAALIVLLGLGGWNVSRIYANHSRAPYRVMKDEIREFAARLREEVPEGGRVMFAGAMVHYFGRGHVAYLPVLTGREMMAVDYYHFPMSYVKYEYPPDGFNESPEAVLEFIRLYNVTHVVTFHDRWKAAFRGLEDQAEELEGYEAVRASVFRMRREPSLFIRGTGRVTADFSRIDVQVDAPEAEAVLGYNWAEGLSVPEPVELFPWEAGNGVRLIGIRPNGQTAFRIRYRSWL